jgi:hypothetical protein
VFCLKHSSANLDILCIEIAIPLIIFLPNLRLLIDNISKKAYKNDNLTEESQMENEKIDVSEFLEIEHTDEARQEAENRAALIMSWQV